MHVCTGGRRNERRNRERVVERTWIVHRERERVVCVQENDGEKKDKRKIDDVDYDEEQSSKEGRRS